MERKKTQKRPPDIWFQTYNPPGSDILSVGMSEEFRSMENGEIGRRMNQWINYSRILLTQTAFSQEERTIAAEAIKESEELITKAIGFSPQVIWNQLVLRRHQIQLTPHPSSNGTKQQRAIPSLPKSPPLL